MSIPSAHDMLRSAHLFETDNLCYGWGLGCLDCGADIEHHGTHTTTGHADDCYLFTTDIAEWRVLGREDDSTSTLIACVSLPPDDLHFLVIVVPHDNDPEAVGAFHTPDFSDVLDFFTPGPGPDYPSNQPCVVPAATETPLLRFDGVSLDLADVPAATETPLLRFNGGHDTFADLIAENSEVSS